MDLQLPDLLTDLPAEWWDKACDTCMVMGVYVHGFEKYSKIRVDPGLCFLQLCGVPDAKELLAAQQEENNEEGGEKEREAESSQTAQTEAERTEQARVEADAESAASSELKVCIRYIVYLFICFLNIL